MLISIYFETLDINISGWTTKLIKIGIIDILITSKIPAITHVDYSARIQTVHQETNPRYFKIIEKFKKITGCPILVNTSFNIRGEPIVCSVKDAFRCFMGTNLDILVIEDFVLFKSEQPVSLKEDYKNQFKLD